MLSRCNTPAVIVFVPFGKCSFPRSKSEIRFLLHTTAKRVTLHHCKSKSLKNRVRKMRFFSSSRGDIFRADVVDVQCFGLFTDLLKVHQRRFFLNEHLHKRHKSDTDGFTIITGFFGVESLIAGIFAPKNMSVIASTDFETCVSCSKIGGLGVDDVNCQTVTEIPNLCSLSFRSYWRPRNYRLADSPLAYRVRSTDFRAKERLLAV